MRIVVLDDEELIVRGLTLMVEELRLPRTDVRGFTNAPEAREHLLHQEADLVFIDVRMPKINGIDLIEAIAAEKPDLDFVILSGYQEFEYARRAVRLNVLEYLVKPIDPDDLERILRRLFYKIHRLTPEEYRRIFPEELMEGGRRECPEQLLQIMRYIEENLMKKDVSLTALSDYSGLHATYISALFKRELNLNYSHYVNRLKLKTALRLLREREDLPVAAVAQMLGYTGERQFYRMFKALTGLTPNQYRERQGENPS